MVSPVTRGADGCVVARQVHGLRIDLHRLVLCANGKVQVETHPLADAQRHSLVNGLKTLSGGAHGVIADWKIGQDIASVTAGFG